MDNTRILVVEDDPNLGELLTNFMNAKGYDTERAHDGEEGLQMHRSQPYDFLILDVMMPKMDGFTMAKQVRQTDTNTPILFLTAKGMKEDKLEAFDIGADDYMTKPFTMEELLARVKAILNRVKPTTAKELKEFKFKPFEFNSLTQELNIKGKVTKLTTKESQLFTLLCRHANDVLDRQEALINVWGDDSYFNGRSMDVYITKLRKHLKTAKDVEIKNIHGKGFKLIAPFAS